MGAQRDSVEVFSTPRHLPTLGRLGATFTFTTKLHGQPLGTGWEGLVGLGSGSRYAPRKTDFFTKFGTGSDFWYWASQFGTGLPNLVLGRPIWYWAGLFGTKKYFLVLH